jgi:hypothetical protein
MSSSDYSSGISRVDRQRAHRVPSSARGILDVLARQYSAIGADIRAGNLPALAVTGLHVLRRHQPHPMIKLREFTRPIMGRGAGFHADQARRQRLEELQHLAAP